MKRFRLLSLALLLPLLSSLLTGCWDESIDNSEEDILGAIITEPEEPEEAPPEKSTALTSFALPYFAKKTLDPVTCADGAQQAVASLLYEGLFILDETLSPQKVLCESYTYDDDTMTYRFTLRKGVTFSDGTPLSVYDVLATYQRAALSPRYAARFANVTSMSVSGSELVIALNVNNAAFPALLDIPVVKAGTETNVAPTGTGPYLFCQEVDQAFLTENPDWWQSRALPIARIDLVPNSDSETLVYQFNSREIQILTTDLTGSEALIVGGNASFYDYPTTTMQYLGFNTASPLFADAAVRQAVSLAIDRDTVVSAYFSDHALPASYPLSPLSPRYPENSPEAFADAAGALEALDGSQSAVLIVNEESPAKEKAANYVAAVLSDYIQVEVQVLPWETYLSRLQSGNFDLYWGEVRLTADFNVSALIGTGGSANYGGYTDATMDAHLANALSGSPSSLAQFYNYFHQQTPIAPLCFKQFTLITPSESVTGVNPSASTPFYQFHNWTITLDITLD